MRRREPGEIITAPDGTESLAEGGERVWDHEEYREPFTPGAYLCKGHLSRARELIGAAPEMVSWMREQLEPAGNPVGGDEPHDPNGPGSKPPVAVTAVDAADEVLALLCSWAEAAADAVGIEAPDTSAAWRVFRTSLDIGEEGTDDGWDWHPVVKGFRGGSTALVNGVARWLLDHLEDIAQHDLVADLVEEVADNRKTNLARWPYEDRPRAVPGVRCDECGKRTVMFYPPAQAPVYGESVPLDSRGNPIPLVKPLGFRQQGPKEVRRYSDGRTVVAIRKELAYAHPVLVQCRDAQCGHIIPAHRWRQLVREIEQKGKRA
jgi:hypothetical protein